MGASRWDNQAIDHERPAHRVRISKPFYMGVYEVTQEEYQKVMGDNPSEFQGNPRLPVHGVSWHEAVRFCERLTALPSERSAGRRYRLPTEAEWEYACRAGTRTAFHFGNSPDALDDYAWYNRTRELGPSPIGRKKPNRWGLYDMHGNVAEWCSDWYCPKYYAISLTTDPKGPEGPERPFRTRVHRGGIYRFGCGLLRSSARRCHSPNRTGSDLLDGIELPGIGFRVVMTTATLSQ